MKKIVLSFFIFYSLAAQSQNTSTIEAFRQLTTTEQRFDFMAGSNILKMDKPTYDALLPIIIAKKDDKTLFYWHFRYFWFRQHLNVDTKAMVAKILEDMTHIAAKSGLEVESVVAQCYVFNNPFSSEKLSEQQTYSTYTNSILLCRIF